MQIYCRFCGAANDCASNGDFLCRQCGRPLEKEKKSPEYHLKNDTVLNHDYRVAALLGEGGFGITYKAFDSQTGNFVAIKELYSKEMVRRDVHYSTDVVLTYDLNRANYEKTKKRFIKEAKALMQFRGEKGIVQILDYFEENNTAYLVMEYLEGMTLKEYLKQSGILSWEKAYQLLAPVMESLGRIHEKGFVHRDISSSNIMVVGEGELVLLDFGASKRMHQDTYTHSSVFAKKGYTPVEQYSGDEGVGAWTDVYALMAVFYECVTGNPPPDSLQRVIYDEYKPIREKGSKVPKGIEDICSKGLAIRVTDRFSSISELMMAFERQLKIRPGKKSVFVMVAVIIVIFLCCLIWIIF